MYEDYRTWTRKLSNLLKMEENRLDLVHPQEMESAIEKRLRYRSIRIGQFVLFIFATGFSIILTGVYPYMKEVSSTLFSGYIELEKI